MPEDVQVEEPELIGAMSAEEAGEMVGIPVFTIREPSKILVVLALKSSVWLKSLRRSC